MGHLLGSNPSSALRGGVQRRVAARTTPGAADRAAQVSTGAQGADSALANAPPDSIQS
jgi:hypothetical protein